MIVIVIILIISGATLLLLTVINYILWEIRLEKAKEEIASAVMDRIKRDKIFKKTKFKIG